MISTQAARTVHARLLEVLGAAEATPAGVLEAGEARLRSAGLSRTKARALLALAEGLEDGSLDLEALRRFADEKSASAKKTEKKKSD